MQIQTINVKAWLMHLPQEICTKRVYTKDAWRIHFRENTWEWEIFVEHLSFSHLFNIMNSAKENLCNRHLAFEKKKFCDQWMSCASQCHTIICRTYKNLGWVDLCFSLLSLSFILRKCDIIIIAHDILIWSCFIEGTRLLNINHIIIWWLDGFE